MESIISVAVILCGPPGIWQIWFGLFAILAIAGMSQARRIWVRRKAGDYEWTWHDELGYLFLLGAKVALILCACSMMVNPPS